MKELKQKIFKGTELGNFQPMIAIRHMNIEETPLISNKRGSPESLTEFVKC